MSNLTFEGMAIADGVVDTIVSIAVQEVEGVVGFSSSASSGLLAGLKQKPAVKGIEIMPNEDDSVSVSARVIVKYGYALPVVAEAIREAVVDSVATQIGLSVSNVDVYIDGIQFS